MSQVAGPKELPPLLRELSGGDRRSIGQSEAVAVAVEADPVLFPVLVSGMICRDPVVRMRAADAVEKVTVHHPEWLQPFKGQILYEISQIQQQEVRWHVAQLMPRLELNDTERDVAVGVLRGYLDDRSRIVVTFSMQALVDLAADDVRLRAEITPIIARLAEEGSPAVRSRGRKLLEELSHPSICAPHVRAPSRQGGERWA